MKKIKTLLILSLGLPFIAFAAPKGFDEPSYYNSNPKGFDNQAPNTVKQVLSKGYDDQFVVLKGRLTKYLGKDRYEFTDNTGSIEVELDDDRDWSYIAKDQLIEIKAIIDKDILSTSLEVHDARVLEK